MPPQENDVRPLRERIVGSWKLLRSTRLVGGVEEPGPFGMDAIGQILYAPDGFVSFNIMLRDRPKFAMSRLAAAPAAGDRAAAYDGYMGYCGRYEVDERESSVLHRIELSSNPNWTETNRKRFIKFIGDQLAHTSPPFLVQGKESTVTFLWTRA